MLAPLPCLLNQSKHSQSIQEAMSVLATLLVTASLLALSYAAPVQQQRPEDFLRLLDALSQGRQNQEDTGKASKQLNRAGIAHKVSKQDDFFGDWDWNSTPVTDKSFGNFIGLVSKLGKKFGGKPEVTTAMPAVTTEAKEVTAEEFNMMDFIQLLLKLFSTFNQSGGNMGDGGNGDSTSSTGILGALGNLFG